MTRGAASGGAGESFVSMVKVVLKNPQSCDCTSCNMCTETRNDQNTQAAPLNTHSYGIPFVSKLATNLGQNWHKKCGVTGEVYRDDKFRGQRATNVRASA